MNYIEFKLTRDNKIISTYVNGNKKIVLSYKDAKIIYKLLKENNVKPEQISINNYEILRYHNVNKYLGITTKINQKNITKKVKRTNKFTPAVAILSSALSLLLILNSCENNKKTQLPKESISTTEESYNNKTSIEEQITEIPEEIIIDKYFDFEFKDKSNTEELEYVKTNYHDIIEKYSKMYGLSTNLMTAMISCESKGNSDITSKAGAYGLLQIKAEGNWNWVGKQLTAYNFERNEYETVTVCLDSDGELKRKMLYDPEYNIKIGCMIMANNLVSTNYDILCAIQAYNTGMKPIYLKKEYGDEWINYRNEYLDGSTYIEYVLSYIEKEDNIITCYDSENNSYNICVNNVYKPYVKQR